MESIYKGEFFVYNTPAKRENGLLKIKEDGSVEVEVFNSLFPEYQYPKNLFSDLKSEKFTIWGILLSNKKITLLECFEINHESFFGGKSHTIYLSNYTLLGVHVANKNETIFKKAIFEFSHLNRWITNKSLQINRDTDFQRLSFKDYVEVTIKIDEETHLDIWCNCAVSFNNLIQIKNSRKFNLISDYNKSLQYFLYKIYELKKLFSLLLGYKLNVYNVRFLINESDTEYVDFYQKNVIEYDLPNERIFFIKYIDIQPNLNEIYFNWKNCEANGTLYITSILASALHSDKINNELFLSLFQASEGIHRSSYKKEGEEYEKLLIDEILSYIPDGEARQWLIEKIKYGYEISARKRIDQMINVYLSPLTKFNREKRKLLTDDLLQYRNHLTHLGNDDKISMSFEKIYHYSQVLQIIALSSVFEKIGIADSFFRKGLSTRYYNTINWLTKGF